MPPQNIDTSTIKLFNKKPDGAEAEEDYGADLVREIIEENPPEDRGHRLEWETKEGWHRREDVGSRGGGNRRRMMHGRRELSLSGHDPAPENTRSAAINGATSSRAVHGTTGLADHSMHILHPIVCCGCLLLLVSMVPCFHRSLFTVRWKKRQLNEQCTANN